MTKNKMDENILVVEREDLFLGEELTFQGLLTERHLVRTISRGFKHFFEARRGDAEENEEWKQPIPYAIVRKGDQIFVYKRLGGGGEKRLHNQLSFGVGGHMNHVGDVGNWNVNLMENFSRELHEELEIDAEYFEYDIVGLINDDENEVGKVHIGILIVVDLPEDGNVSVKETDTLEGDWYPIDELKQPAIFEQLESWSQIALGALVVRK